MRSHRSQYCCSIFLYLCHEFSAKCWPCLLGHEKVYLIKSMSTASNVHWSTVISYQNNEMLSLPSLMALAIASSKWESDTCPLLTMLCWAQNLRILIAEQPRPAPCWTRLSEISENVAPVCIILEIICAYGSILDIFPPRKDCQL